MTHYLRKYRERKYLMRIMLSINLLIVASMLASLLSAYMYSRKISLDSQREANEKVLSQINYNISYMNETVKNFAISLYYDNDMAQLLFSRELDRFEDTLRINKLNKTIAYNSFVHSIVFYNSKRDTYFTSGDDSISSPKSNLMDITKSYLAGTKPIYKMQLMPIAYAPNTERPQNSQEIFSLYMYDSVETYNKTDSALIINIKPEWLFQKLELMNARSDDPSNRIFIMDQNKEIYSPVAPADEGLSELKEEIYRRIDASNQAVSQFTYKLDGQKQIVNYMANASTDWVIVDIEPYTGVLAQIEQLKKVFITVAAISFFLALLASLFVSNKLYNPVNVLLKQTERVSGVAADRPQGKDEFSYVTDIYDRLVDKLASEQSRQAGNENIICSYHLRKLVTDSTAITAEELRSFRERGYLKTDLEWPFVLGVIKVDDYKKLKETRGLDLKLLQFAVSNIVQEVVSEVLPVDAVDLREEHFVLLFDIGKPDEDTYERISASMRKAQTIVNDLYHITFTVALSDLVPSYGELTYSYERTLDYLQYRMNVGANAVITPEIVREKQDNHDAQIPPELERKLIEGIKSGRQEQVHQELDRIRGVISGMSSDAVIQSVVHVGIIIKQTIREINQNKVSPLTLDLRSIDGLVFEKETLDEIFEAFVQILDAIFVDHKAVVENKVQVIVDTIKDVIQANYANANLSLQEISDLLKMSPAYVGRIFKKYETVSVADYINEVRLQNAVILLEKNNWQVNEISEKVGFSSHSYFFKLFKKRFGTTPKDYRIKKSMGL
ncbi:transcriptional regulator, AraC family [Cohnella sp. OV330]|uniref:AraC family transcriptional regulator n=1 Tax=Cohnella sp. OV330 TaxID=1855288 RepID=UPI0008E5CE8C|nr:AraC family transcriptional regulator [Cohnella sp. OV330]SFA73240.1 transcriptional regulator, AraC family [Cohnella sp. OV330]